jgi:hypothetical protein
VPGIRASPVGIPVGHASLLPRLRRVLTVPFRGPVAPPEHGRAMRAASDRVPGGPSTEDDQHQDVDGDWRPEKPADKGRFAHEVASSRSGCRHFLYVELRASTVLPSTNRLGYLRTGNYFVPSKDECTAWHWKRFSLHVTSIQAALPARSGPTSHDLTTQRDGPSRGTVPPAARRASLVVPA